MLTKLKEWNIVLPNLPMPTSKDEGNLMAIDSKSAVVEDEVQPKILTPDINFQQPDRRTYEDPDSNNATEVKT